MRFLFLLITLVLSFEAIPTTGVVALGTEGLPELISEEEVISWRSGRKISFQNNIKRLKVSKNNEVEDIFIHNNNILVLNKENKILGIACLDESFAIKPKVVFNAIG